MRYIQYILMAFACCTLAVSCGKVDKDFDATGFFEAVEVTVSAEVNGRIMAMDITEGQQVAAGQAVGCIDSVQLYYAKLQLENNIIALRNNLPDSEAQTAALREQIAKQKKEKERVERLLKSGAATPKQLDDINSAILVMESELNSVETTLGKSTSSMKAQIAALEMQVAQTADRLAKCRIVSPIDGTVLSQYARAGELAAVGKPLFKVADTQHMILRAYFTLGQLKDIKIGQKVKVTANFGGDNNREYEGTINWISEKSEFTPKSVQTKDDRENLVYAVKIGIENDGYVKIGMYGEVTL